MKRNRRVCAFGRGIRCLWRDGMGAAGAKTAVSLHSHTMHSMESLDFIPRVLGKVPRLFEYVQGIAERRRESGSGIEFARAFWRPPLHARAAWDLEAGQIRDSLQLEPLVSITDHDSLEGCADLRALGIETPYSLEWTVPYGATIVHLGVHNLPDDQARAMAGEMARYTRHRDRRLLAELLADLDGMPDVLLVLNHPFSCELRLDREAHVALLGEFLKEFGGRIHALELNGLQPASDNRRAICLAAEAGIPIVSGGDRHCLEPSANVNLTDASSFTEFVHEIRYDGMSRVLFLPQYREPLAARYIEFIWQAVRNYAHLAGRERWVDRIFYDHEQRGVLPLAAFWPNGGPWGLRYFIAAVGLLAAPQMRATLRLALGEQGEVGS